MTPSPFSALLAAALLGLALAGPAVAADAVPPADKSQPVTTARVGGSPADAAFRDAQQKTGAAYREARAACKARPSAERGACMNAARSQLKQARLEAKAAHDAAKKVR
jgi:acyl-CoA reductase-like NAD-dependent aldehyde dehydrogenase